MTPRLLLLFLVLAAAAGVPAHDARAQTPAPAPAAGDIDPVGQYDLSLIVQGVTITSSIRVEKRADASFGGTVTAQAYGTFQIETLKVSGKTMTIGIFAQDGSPVTITLTLDGDQVTGEWAMSNDGSKITGRKLPES